MRDEKLHAAVARSTFRSQNAQSTSCSDDFWKLRCRKSARRCGAKHISKSKCTRHTRFGALLEVERSARRCGAKPISKSKCTRHTILRPLLEVEMLEKCTPLWREAHFQVKRHKTHHSRTTFRSRDVEKVHTVVARSPFPSQNAQSTPFSDHKGFCTFPKVSKTWGFCSSFNYNHHYTTLHYTTLHYNYNNNYNYNYTTIHYTPLHSTTQHYTQLHYTTLITTTTATTTTLHYTTLHFTSLHSITPQYNYNYTPLHFTTLHSITPHYSYNYNYITLH